MLNGYSDLLLRNCRIVDATGNPPTGLTAVLVKDGLIADIMSSDLAHGHTGTVIDLNGMTLLPGIINAHVHMDFNNIEPLREWLRAGVTTVREMGILGNTTVPEALAIRDEAMCSLDYPRVIMAGKFVTAPGGYGGSSPAHVSDAAEARGQVNELLDLGCDFIKTVLEDGYDPSTFGLPKLDPALLKEICDAAHSRNAQVTAHATQAKNLEILVDAGISEVAHVTYDPLPDSLIKKMVSRDVCMVPTLNLYKSFCDKYGAPFYQTCIDNLLRFIQAGGKIALGTDFIQEELPWFESGMPVYEMQLLRESGLSNMQVIMAATKQAAEVLGIGDKVGTIEKGKVADLIAVDGEPLVDLGCLREVVLVMKGGSVVRNNLPRIAAL